MIEPNGESSLYKDAAARDAFMAAYDRIMTERWPVPFETQDVPTRFGSTHVVTSGPTDGPPLVLLHGGGTCSAMWFSIVGLLADAGYRCVAFDRVGDVGRSTIRELPTDDRALAAWLLDALDATGLDAPPMIGLSYGAFMNINFARFHPDRISSIIMLTPGGVFAKLRTWWIIRMSVSIGSRFPPLVRNAYSYIAAGRQPDDDEFALASLSWKHWSGPEFMPPVYTDAELAVIPHPALLLVGDRDVIYDPRTVLERAERTMPNVQVDLIPGAGHTLSVDQPEAVARRILSFLSDQTRAPD